MPRRVFIFLKKTGNSVSYLPHRQLRKYPISANRYWRGYLPHRQLRKFVTYERRCRISYLPHRQLRNAFA